MRAVIFVLIIAVLVGHRGDCDRLPRTSTRSAAPRRRRSPRPRNGVTAKGGQAPAFDVETGSVKVGTTKHDGEGARRSRSRSRGRTRRRGDEQRQ